MRNRAINILSYFSLTAVVLLTVLITPSTAKAATDRQHMLDSINNVLSQIDTPADSIMPMFNIYDLLTEPDRIAYSYKLIETAGHAGRYDIALDVIRNNANSNMRDIEVIDRMIDLTATFPESEDRSNSQTFLRMVRNACKAQGAVTAKERVDIIEKLMREANANPPETLNDQIVLLHEICIYLSDITEGDLLVDYLHKLGELIEKMPETSYALKNMYYVWASIIYTKTGQTALAIQACNHLLDQIDLLDQRNQRLGRVHRDYDAHRYIVYTRLLENAEGLDPADELKYYNEAIRLTGTSSRAAKTYASAPLPDIYHAMYHKNYRKAFELIDRCKDNPYLNKRRLQIMKMYIGAATAIGENQALLNSYPEYARLLEEELNTREKERYRELQVIYDVNEIKIDNLRLKEREENARKQMWRAITIVCVCMLVALAIFSFFMLRLSRRKTAIANRLKITNRNLMNESRLLREARDQLKTARDMAEKADKLKTEFINNMSHEVKVPLQAMLQYSQMILENVDDDRKKFLSTFADRLVINCELVNTIVNDVLQLAELHNSTLKVSEQPYDLLPICEAAADALRPRLHPGVTLDVTAPAGDIIIRTDRYRLQQILTNLLSNAVKFTDEGTVSLSMSTTADNSQVIFTVTDTGIGIDPSYAETIFERFSKLDNNIPGAGLGLTIARLLAHLLGGDLILDTAYRAGARFILSLPNRV